MKRHPVHNLYVTKSGLVFKEARINARGHKKGCLYMLPTHIDKNTQYLVITDYNPKDQRSYNRNVHQLVMETYREKIPGKPYIDHIDRNKLNPNLDNLRYVSQSENNLNRDVSDKALDKWGFHPCENRNAYKAAWARAKWAKDAAYRAKSVEANKAWRHRKKDAASRTETVTISKEAA